MDWYTWLSKTSLDPSLVHEYTQAFLTNELEEEDISYFNHEFLQSMGILIAKHRLEILKLAQKNTKKHPISKLFLVLKKTKKSLGHFLTTLVHNNKNNNENNNNKALIFLPNKHKKINHNTLSYSSRWKKSMMIKNTRKLMNNNNSYNNYYYNNSKQERLMLTNGDYLCDYLGDNNSMDVSTPKLNSYSNPLMYDIQQNKEKKVKNDDDDNNNNNNNNYNNNKDDHEENEDDDDYWSPTLEEIRWDAMFHDLKPT